MINKRCLVAGALLCAAAFSSGAYAQASADDTSKSNNPLNLSASFNTQDHYTPSLFGVGGRNNDVPLRPTIPVGPPGPIGVPEIFRAAVPVSARPDRSGDRTGGIQYTTATARPTSTFSTPHPVLVRSPTGCSLPRAHIT